MPTPLTTAAATSSYLRAAGTCLGMMLLFGVLFGSFRIGLVVGIVAGAILSLTMEFLETARTDTDQAR